MKEKAIFVLTPMRTGSSTVARILHENLGIHMGSEFHSAEEHTPNGPYEDKKTLQINTEFVKGYTTLPKFWQGVINVIDKRPPVSGMKDPMLYATIGLWLTWLKPENAVLIRTVRPLQEVYESCLKWGLNLPGFTDEALYEELERRQNMLDNFLAGRKHYIIDFSYKREEEDIEEELRTILTSEGIKVWPKSVLTGVRQLQPC